MSQKIINITLVAVIEEIEKILETYPQYPHQEIFTVLALYENLVNYVTSQIPNTYAVIEEQHSSSSKRILPSYSEEELQQIEDLVHCGIRHLLQISNTTN
jgi:hypothetical protein